MIGHRRNEFAPGGTPVTEPPTQEPRMVGHRRNEFAPGGTPVTELTTQEPRMIGKARNESGPRPMPGSALCTRFVTELTAQEPRMIGKARNESGPRPMPGYSQSQRRTCWNSNQSRVRSNTMSQAPSSRKRWLVPGMITRRLPSFIPRRARTSDMRM